MAFLSIIMHPLAFLGIIMHPLAFPGITQPFAFRFTAAFIRQVRPFPSYSLPPEWVRNGYVEKHMEKHMASFMPVAGTEIDGQAFTC